MMPGQPPGAGLPGWRFDSATGYYLNPSTGVYFDPQRGAYGVDGRWISGAEYTAVYGRPAAGPPGAPAAQQPKHNNRYVAHPALSRGGVGDASTGIGAPAPASASAPVHQPPPNPGHHHHQRPGGDGAGFVPAYGGNADAAEGVRRLQEGMRRRQGAPAAGPNTHPSSDHQHHGDHHHQQRHQQQHHPPATTVSTSRAAPPTPLGLAAERGDASTCRALLKDGADPDGVGPRGNRPLHYASYEGHAKAAELLLASDADANARNDVGCTPLHNASTRGHVDVVASLIAAGADVNAVDVDGVAPLHVASDRGVTEALLRAGADPNARRRDGRTPLHEACERGDGWATEALLGLGAAPDAREKGSRGGRTPLHVTGDWRCARALCAAGADVEAVADGSGWTPLQTAAATGEAEVVRTLLEAGARVNARTSVKIGWGKTASDLARERGHREVTRLLGGGGSGRGGADDRGGSNERSPGGDAPKPTVEPGSNPSLGGGEYPHGAQAYAQYARAPHAKEAEAYPEGSGGVSARIRRFASSRAFVAFVVVALVALLVGLSAIRGMRNELAEWRALREKKAARREKAEKAAAFKKSQEEEAARRRAVLAEAEVARVLACPAVVTEAAAKAAEEAKAKGEPKPRKDHSAVHRCVLDLGGPGTSTELRADSEKGGGDPSRCVVCAEFLADVAEKVKIELAGSGSKDGAGVADRVLGTACGEAQGGGNSRHGKLCDSLLTLRRDVARPLGLGVPPRKICERVSQKDALICELKAAKEGTVGAEGGDVAAADAFKRISLLVHPDKHRGHHGAKANAAFRLLKQARDHFDLKAKREAERLKKEEGGE